MVILGKYFGYENIKLAWERYTRDRNKDVKDYFGIEVFGFDLETNLKMLSAKLVSGKYSPSRPEKYFEPKQSGTQRTKTILRIEDALVYQAIANIISWKNYLKFEENNDYVFGSVLHPEVAKGIELLTEDKPQFYFFSYWPELYKKFVDSVNKEIESEKTVYKFETDITGFFDSIPHSRLLLTLHDEFRVEKEILELLGKCLNIWSGTRESITPGIGIPQGPQPSSFFANLYLHQLDGVLIKKGNAYYRYMDDIRIYSHNEDELDDSLVLIDTHLKGRGLSINSSKTSVEEIKDREAEKIKTFEFFTYDQIVNDSPLNPIANDQEDSELESFSEQEPDHEFKAFHFSYVNDQEVATFCEKELIDVKAYINDYFEISAKKAKYRVNPTKAFAKDAMKLGYRYRHAIALLKEIGKEIQPEVEYSPVWLLLAEKVFWKINQFCWVINLYPPSDWVKQELLELFNRYHRYEWIQHQIIVCLSINQKYSDSELRNFYKLAKEHKSFYVRWALYKLLLYHISPQKQLYTTVVKSIQEEKNNYLKESLFLDISRKRKGELTLKQLAKSLGIA